MLKITSESVKFKDPDAWQFVQVMEEFCSATCRLKEFENMPTDRSSSRGVIDGSIRISAGVGQGGTSVWKK